MHEREKTLNPYLDLSPSQFVKEIENENTRNLFRLKNKLQSFSFNHQNICFAVAGSDGKFERHPQSGTELVIIQTDSSSSNIKREFTDWHKQHKEKSEELYLYNERTYFPEIKSLNSEIPLSYAWEDSKSVYPDRILNAVQIIGNEEVLRMAKKQVLLEITSDNSASKRLRKKMKDQLREYRLNLENGIFHKNHTFTIDPSLEFYNEHKDSYTTGFKTSGIRLIQRELDLLVISSIRNNILSLGNAADLPTNTVNKITALKKNRIIPPEMPIENSYSWFLQKYHQAQQEYLINKSPVAISFKKEEFLQHKNVVLNFLKLKRKTP